MKYEEAKVEAGRCGHGEGLVAEVWEGAYTVLCVLRSRVKGADLGCDHGCGYYHRSGGCVWSSVLAVVVWVVAIVGCLGQGASESCPAEVGPEWTLTPTVTVTGTPTPTWVRGVTCVPQASRTCTMTPVVK